jgi:hypothetical protein
MTVVAEVHDLSERAKETRAVAAYLERHSSISNHMAIYDGVPGYGVITRLGARIYELREDGYEIRTVKEGRDTVYQLIAVPKAQQQTLL